MEHKITAFAASFSAWPRIAGFNWWHAGGNSFAMSTSMIRAIAEAKFGVKPYGVPIAPVAWRLTSA